MRPCVLMGVQKTKMNQLDSNTEGCVRSLSSAVSATGRLWRSHHRGLVYRLALHHALCDDEFTEGTMILRTYDFQLNAQGLKLS